MSRNIPCFLMAFVPKAAELAGQAGLGQARRGQDVGA